MPRSKQSGVRVTRKARVTTSVTNTPRRDEKDRKRESTTSNGGIIFSPSSVQRGSVWRKGQDGKYTSGEEIFPTNTALCVLPWLCFPTETLWDCSGSAAPAAAAAAG